MPTVNGRYVPEWHAAAQAAAATPEDDADAEPTEEAPAPKKRATRKRSGKKAETAMVDLPDAED